MEGGGTMNVKSPPKLSLSLHRQMHNMDVPTMPLETWCFCKSQKQREHGNRPTESTATINHPFTHPVFLFPSDFYQLLLDSTAHPSTSANLWWPTFPHVLVLLEETGAYRGKPCSHKFHWDCSSTGYKTMSPWNTFLKYSHILIGRATTAVYNHQPIFPTPKLLTAII